MVFRIDASAVAPVEINLGRASVSSYASCKIGRSAVVYWLKMICAICFPASSDSRLGLCADCTARFAPNGQMPEWLAFLLRDRRREARANARNRLREISLDECRGGVLDGVMLDWYDAETA